MAWLNDLPDVDPGAWEKQARRACWRAILIWSLGGLTVALSRGPLTWGIVAGIVLPGFLLAPLSCLLVFVPGETIRPPRWRGLCVERMSRVAVWILPVLAGMGYAVGWMRG